MGWVTKFCRSSIGSKLLMCITGLVLLGFVIGHLAGNLLVFLGRDAFNEYAEFLHQKPALIWTTRIVLLICLVVHVATAIRLRAINKAARPERYAKRATVQASVASRAMMGTGSLILIYVVYHLLHFTVAVTDSAAAEFKLAGDTFGMLVAGFSHVPVVLVYVIANAMLAWHLSHGISSAFQTLGVFDARYTPIFRTGGLILAAAIGAGFIAIPLSVLLGILQP